MVHHTSTPPVPVRRSGPLLVFCVFGLLLTFGFLVYYRLGPGEREGKIRSFLAQADNFTRYGNTTGLLQLAMAHQQQMPDDANGYFRAAEAYLYGEQYSQARTQWAKAVGVNPETRDTAKLWQDAADRVEALKQPMQLVSETEEEKERNSIRHRVRELLKAGKYGELDAYAASLRNTKQTFPDGRSKLFYFYQGLAIPANEITPSVQGYEPQNDEEAQRTQVSREDTIAGLEQWARSSPTSVTAQVALMDAYVEAGWRARGTGYAKDVTNEGWRVFKSRLQQAQGVMQSSQSLSNQCPFWYAFAMRLSLGQSWADKDKADLYAKAIQAFPASNQIRFQRFVSLLPQWGNTKGAWEAETARTADAVAAAGSADDGDLFYARTALFMEDFHDNVFRESSLDKNRALRGFRVMCQRYSHSLEGNSQACMMIGLAKDYWQARQLFQNNVKGKVVLSVWRAPVYFQRRRVAVFSTLPQDSAAVKK